MSNLARGKTYTAPAATGAQPDVNFQLTNNVYGADWVGFNSSNPVVVIDLGAVNTVTNVHVYFLQGAGVVLPSSLLIEVSVNGIAYTTLGTVTPSGAGIVIAKVFLNGGISGRYVRITCTSSALINIGEIGVYDDVTSLPLEPITHSDIIGITEVTPVLDAVEAFTFNAPAYLLLPMLTSTVIAAITTTTPNLEVVNQVLVYDKSFLLNVQNINPTVTLPNPNVRFENDFANEPKLELAGFNTGFGLSSPQRLVGRAKLVDDIRRLVLRVLLEQGLLKSTVTVTDFSIIAASIEAELANADNWWAGQAAPVRATAFSVGLALPDYSSITARADGSVDVVVKYERVSAAAVIQGDGVGELVIPFEFSVVG